MNDYLTKAIRSLRPTGEFSIIDSDYSTIKWDILDGEAPTLAEIEIAIEKIKSDEIIEIATKAQAKLELLDRLGITAEEAQLLLS